MRAEAEGPGEGSRVLLKRVTRTHAGRAWLSLRYPLGVWADVKGSNALVLCSERTGSGQPRLQGLGTKSGRRVQRTHLSPLPFRKETLGS